MTYLDWLTPIAVAMFHHEQLSTVIKLNESRFKFVNLLLYFVLSTDIYLDWTRNKRGKCCLRVYITVARNHRRAAAWRGTIEFCIYIYYRSKK